MQDLPERIHRHAPLWGCWNVDALIGSGTFGKVYRVSHKDFGQTYVSAVKIISIPDESRALFAGTPTGAESGTIAYRLREMVQTLVNEVSILYSLSGNTNILGYHDHLIIEHADGLGWDVLIRMENAVSLPRHLIRNRMTRHGIAALGLDLCTALDVCSKRGIIHRDIKDENIFVNEDGIFKLGDFGIAMNLVRGGWTATMLGTPHFMAPEVFHGEAYGARVDLYSLGIVLFRLLNHGRLPCMPRYPAPVMATDGAAALQRRMRGETFPPPDQAGGRLADVVLKACAYRAADRYGSAAEMKADLLLAMNELSPEAASEPITFLAPSTGEAPDAPGFQTQEADADTAETARTIPRN